MADIKEEEKKAAQERLDQENAGAGLPEALETPGMPVEKRELQAGEINAQKELREKIEAIDLQAVQKTQASASGNDLSSLGQEEKIKKLLQLAKQKGVIYAVQVAKKMNDAYTLDMLHDLLAKEGLYKNFLK